MWSLDVEDHNPPQPSRFLVKFHVSLPTNVRANQPPLLTHVQISINGNDEYLAKEIAAWLPPWISLLINGLIAF